MRNEPLDDRQADDDESPAFDVRETVWFGVLRSRGLVLAFALIGFGAGLLWGASQPNTYLSQAKLLLRIGEREQVTSEALVAGERARESQPTIEDELHLLRDKRIFEEVVADLGVDYVLSPADPARYDADDTPLHVHLMHQLQALLIAQRASVSGAGNSGVDRVRDAIRLLERDTDIGAEFGSNVISVRHTSTSPEKAKRITDALVEACIRRHREHFSIERRLEPMLDKLSQQENQLVTARQQRATHIENCGLIDIETQGELLWTELDSYQTAHALAEIERNENRQRLEVLRRQLASTPRLENVAFSTRQAPNPQYAALEERQRLLNGQKIDLQQREMPRMQRDQLERQLDEQIKSVRDDLAKTPREIVDTGEVTEQRENPLYPDLKRDIAALEVTDQGLASRLHGLQENIARVRERIETLRVCTDLHEEMNSSIRRYQVAFEEMEIGYNRLESLAMIDERGETNLSVLQNGSLPLEKQGPRRARLLLMGLVAGGLLGVGAAVMRQLTDPRLRYPRGAARILGIPALGVVPELKSARQLPRGAGRPV